MKIFDKIKKFYNDHKIGCRIAIGAVAVTATGLIIRSFKKEDEPQSFVDGIYDLDTGKLLCSLEDDTDDSNNEEKKADTTDIWSRNWDEKYRDTYNLVQDFAKTINLEVGEEYIIGNYYDIEGKQENVVSHLVDGDAAYPPEEAEEK